MIEISACMIVQDEQKYIRRAIENLKPHVAEIVVLDGGSTDGTDKLAKDLGCKVFYRPFDFDFAAQRNAAMAHCENDWVLWCDADEWYSRQFYEVLPKIPTIAAAHNASVVRVWRVDVIDNIVWAVETQDRMLNRRFAQWQGRVHEWTVSTTAASYAAALLLAPQHFLVHEHTMKRQWFNNMLYHNIQTGVSRRPANTQGAEYHEDRGGWVEIETDRDG